MIPDPLHPAIVHFPIVLAVLVPILASVVFWAIERGHVSRWSWLAVAALQLAVVGSGWAAIETGEHEEERVERIVAERHIEAHEEAAERFLALAVLALPLAAAGLLAGRLGAVNRGLTLAISLAVLAAVADTGHEGGELVYRHGAASAYLEPGGANAGGHAATGIPPGTGRHHDED